MDLSTITRIEQYLCDALIASPLIPVNVNVMRLADAADKEGVIEQTNNIVVRYTNSSSAVTNKVPLIYQKTLYFELNFSCQNYLTTSGHDFATQLLSGSEITISGGSPSGAYVQVIEPFHCTSSQFTGLTPQSQYTYSQTYTLVVEEVLPFIALDPCVQRGDCRQIFPGNNVVTSLPLGGVIEEASGEVYVPWYPGTDPDLPDGNNIQGIRWENEVTQTGNWVFVCDPSEVFLEDPYEQPIYLLSNNNYTEDGRLVVTIWDAQTNEPLREVFYEGTGKKVARYAVELWRNTIGGSRGKAFDGSFTSGFNVGEFAVVKGGVQLLFTDPLNPESPTQTLMGGTLVGIKTDTYIQTSSGKFFLVVQSPQGKGWLREGNFEVAAINSLWKLGCLPCEGSSNTNNLC